MKKICYSKILLLTAIIMLNWTAYGQPSNDKILITREEQRNCIKWYNENLYKDSIIYQKDRVIEFKDTVISNKISQNKAISDTLTSARLDNTNLTKKVKRNRRIAIGGISGFIGTLILLFTIK